MHAEGIAASAKKRDGLAMTAQSTIDFGDRKADAGDTRRAMLTKDEQPDGLGDRQGR